MLYKFLHIIFKITQLVYFKKVSVVGNENIPLNEANLIIANHPSAFMDPILAGINIKTPINFLAAEEFMGGKRMSKFLASNFNMIPIYRPSTRPEETFKNNDSFSKCYEALYEKKSILIFAEGHSETQPWIDPLKTGAARIAIQALEKNPALDRINIIALGLNYSNPHLFRSTYLLKVGESITLKQNETYDKYSLTQNSQDQLVIATNSIEQKHSEWQYLLLKLKKNELKLEIETEFIKVQEFITRLNTLEINESNKFEALKIQTLDFKSQLKQNNLTIEDFIRVNTPVKMNGIRLLLSVLIFLPGFVLNAFPLFITKWFVNQKEFKYSFEGSMYFAFGTAFTFGWHLLSVILAFFFIGWYSFLVPIFLVLFGFVSLKTYDVILPWILRKKVKKSFQNSDQFNALYLKIIKNI